MQIRTPDHLLAMALAALLSLSASASETKPADRDRTAITHQLDRYEQALNSADIDTIMRLYAQDAVLMPQHSMPAEGRDAVRTAYRHVFDTIRLNIDFTVDEIGVLSAVNFHHQFADQIRMIMLLKSVSMAGGFLLLAAAGPGPFSLDTGFARA